MARVLQSAKAVMALLSGVSGCGDARWPAVRWRTMLRALACRGLFWLAALAVAGCGGSVANVSGSGGAAGFGAAGGAGATGGTGGTGGFGAFGGFDGGPPSDSGPDGVVDATSDYYDPGCPDAAPLPVDNECDLFHQPGGCPAGEACYPYVDYPTEPCQQERYGTLCAMPGTGGQGDPCPGQGCAMGFVCVITGNGTQCVQDCSLSGPNTCPQGLLCEPIDVKGYGGCF